MNSYNVYFQLISKYFKSQKTQLLVEVCLENYNNRNLYKPSDYMVIGPNKFFVSYISGILPDLDVNGVSELKTYPKGDFFIESSPSVDLAIVSYMLVPIHKIVGFDLGPVPYMNLKGKQNQLFLTI